MNTILKKVIFGLTTALLVAIPAVATPIYNQYETVIKGYLLAKDVAVSGEEKAAQMASGNALAKEAVANGIVMLKNEDDCLPLSRRLDSYVNVLGFHSVNWLYGGSGSGRVVKSTGDEMIDFAQGLRNYGIELNEDLLNYYRSHRPGLKEIPDIDTLGHNRSVDPHGLFDTFDQPITGEYADLLEDAVAEDNALAIVVIGRQGGESEDMPEIQYKTGNKQDETRHGLQITTEEEELLRFAGENFERTIVIINSTNLFQMDFLDTIPGLSAAFLVPPTGCQGADAIAKVLYGETSPSGHTADIIPYDFKENVAYEYCGYEGVSFFSNNAIYGKNQTTNAGLRVRPSLPYVDYVEGIYVGYRYYETADAMGKFDSKRRGNATGYDAVVQYPFGYGLSYTTFSWDIANISLAAGSAISADSEITFQVLVKNTGEYNGRDVVELYLNQPYTAGGIEKSSTKLVDFAKTSELEPGESELVTLRAKARDLASYDCYDLNKNGRTTYEIDSGTYTFRLATDSHHNKELARAGDKATIDYKVNDTILLDKDAYTGVKVDNLFTGDKAVDGKAVDGLDVDGWDIPYISRKNMPASPVHQTSTHVQSTGRAMDDEMLDLCLFGGANGSDATKFNAWNNATEDEFGNPIEIDDFAWNSATSRDYVMEGGELTETGIYLAKNFNDEEAWNQILSQIPYGTAAGFVGKAHPNVAAIAAIGYPAMTSLDGPAQVGSFNAQAKQTGVGFPCDAMLAQTWNKDLLFEVGLEMGTQMLNHGVGGIYGCGMNIHRSPFGGRNYEYFSEDPFLTGALAANYVKGVKLTGGLPIIKHLVAAETETSRDSLYTYMSEQTLREIYLEPFRICVEGEGLCEGAREYKEVTDEKYEPLANAMMTSYNRVGAVWAGGSAALLKGVLFNEWGFRGEIITDYSDYNQYMHLDETLRYGGSLGMAVALKFNWSEGRAKMALRDALKNVIFANLRAALSKAEYDKKPYNGKKSSSAVISEPFDWVTPSVIAFNVVFYSGAAAVFYFLVLGHPGIKFRKKENA